MVLIPISSLPPLHTLVFYTLAVGASYLFYNTGTTDYKKILQRAESEIPAITGQETALAKPSAPMSLVQRVHYYIATSPFASRRCYSDFKRLSYIAMYNQVQRIDEVIEACGSEDVKVMALARWMSVLFEGNRDFKKHEAYRLRDVCIGPYTVAAYPSVRRWAARKICANISKYIHTQADIETLKLIAEEDRELQEEEVKGMLRSAIPRASRLLEAQEKKQQEKHSL